MRLPLCTSHSLGACVYSYLDDRGKVYVSTIEERSQEVEGTCEGHNGFVVLVGKLVHGAKHEVPVPASTGCKVVRNPREAREQWHNIMHGVV